MRFEEQGALRRREMERCVARCQRAAPVLLHHLEKPGRREIEEPPSERHYGVEIVRQGGDLIRREVDEQALAHDQDLARRPPDLPAQGPALGPVGYVTPPPFAPTARALP